MKQVLSSVGSAERYRAFFLQYPQIQSHLTSLHLWMEKTQKTHKYYLLIILYFERKETKIVRKVWFSKSADKDFIYQ